MKQIYFLRHGESKAQTEEQFSFDADLSKRGVKQSELSGELLKDIPFDIAFISPLRRARQTFEVAKLTAASNIFEVNLIEEMPPESYQTLLPYEALPDYGMIKSIDQWLMPLETRAAAFIEMIKEYRDGKYLIVAHQGTINELLKQLLQVTENNASFYSDNCGCSKIIINEEGKIILLYLNRKK